MQFDFLFRPGRPDRAAGDALVVGARPVPLLLVKNDRARRYILRLQADGVARVTIPRGGSASAAREFAARHSGWLEQQIERRATQPAPSRAWLPGAEILFRGQLVKLELSANGAGTAVTFADQQVVLKVSSGDLRPELERHFWRLAAVELPPRTWELVRLHQLPVRRVTVRNQRSRWGSCSVKGTISLNWRLIQTPEFVRDYIILHELMHLRHMNHSRRFWHAVEAVCPDYAQAEGWLKQHTGLLR